MQHNWVLDHIGHAVSNLEAAVDWHRKVSGGTLILREEVADSGVSVAFIQLGGNLIELLAPLGDTSTLSRFLATRGEGLHHICFRVPSIDDELARLRREGVRLIDEVPRIGSREMRIAFLHPKSAMGILIELCSPL